MGEVKLPAGGLAELRRAIEETASSDAVRALREAGRRLAGDAEVAITAEVNGALSSLSVNEFWQVVGRYFDQAGWGRVEHQPVNEGVGAMIAADWAESDPNEGRETPGCHLTTGLLAELLSRVVNQPVAVLEVTCRSHGDGACRFLFGAPTTLISIHQRLAQGGSLEDAITSLSS